MVLKSYRAVLHTPGIYTLGAGLGAVLYLAMSSGADALRSELGRADAHLLLAQYARLVEFHRTGILRRVEIIGRRETPS